jgi:hypothetical protein
MWHVAPAPSVRPGLYAPQGLHGQRQAQRLHPRLRRPCAAQQLQGRAKNRPPNDWHVKLRQSGRYSLFWPRRCRNAGSSLSSGPPDSWPHTPCAPDRSPPIPRSSRCAPSSFPPHTSPPHRHSVDDTAAAVLKTQYVLLAPKAALLRHPLGAVSHDPARHHHTSLSPPQLMNTHHHASSGPLSRAASRYSPARLQSSRRPPSLTARTGSEHPSTTASRRVILSQPILQLAS